MVGSGAEREDLKPVPDLSARDLMDEAIDGAVELIVSTVERNGQPLEEGKEGLGAELIRVVDERLGRLRERRILLGWRQSPDAAREDEFSTLWRREEGLVVLRSRAAALSKGDEKRDRGSDGP